jgi:hypothetical protein
MSVTQKYCADSGNLEMVLEGMHAIPVDNQNGVRTYEIPLG